MTEVSASLPLMPVALLDSPSEPTASVSPLSATEDPKKAFARVVLVSLTLRTLHRRCCRTAQWRAVERLRLGPASAATVPGHPTPIQGGRLPRSLRPGPSCEVVAHSYPVAARSVILLEEHEPLTESR